MSGMTRSSHSQWSAIGHNDAISSVEGAPHPGVPQADGAAGAVRNGAQGELALALSFQLLDGESLPVDVGDPRLVAPSEGEAFRRSVSSNGLVRGTTPESSFELPGEQPPEDEVRHRDLGGLLAPHDGDDGGDDSDGDDGGDGGDGVGSGQFWRFLLIPAELLLAS